MTLMRVADVKSHILAGVEPLQAETVSLAQAAGRVLAKNVEAKLTQPPFDASAMDGYAVRAADIGKAPVRLAIIGRSAAGHGFGGHAGAGEAVRIFTGAPVPSGADTIVIQENAKAGADGVTILEGAAKGDFIRPRGYDFRHGETLIEAGTLLASRHLMLAAAGNSAQLPVRRKPIIAMLANGDELVTPGTDPRPDQIISSIPAALTAAIAAWGGEPMPLPIAKDTRESLIASAEAGREADVLLTIGGASVGEHDLVRSTLESKGARFEVLKAAMRPGKPLMFGFLGKQRVLSLPGNPVSALVCARVFLKPLIGAFLGVFQNEALEEKPLAAPIGPNGEREHYMRAKLIDEAVSLLPDQDSSLMSVLARSNCLVIRPIGAPALPSGGLVPILRLDF